MTNSFIGFRKPKYLHMRWFEKRNNPSYHQITHGVSLAV